MESVFKPSPWLVFTNKMHQRLKSLSFGRHLSENHYENGNIRPVVIKESIDNGLSTVVFTVFIDVDDGVVFDVSYQFFGEAALLAIVDLAAEMIMRKSLLQINRIDACNLEEALKDHPDEDFPKGVFDAYLNLVISCFDELCLQCSDITPVEQKKTPVVGSEAKDFVHPNWDIFSKEEKLSLIKSVIDSEVTPYVEMDDGGVEVQDLIDDREVMIIYSGACTSCFSAIGSTLSAIESILKSKVHHQIIVTPDKSVLSF